ncbi:Beta-catenin-like protein 1 [Holothuria leucospilota]|uniref:Beta-catenin-like protein 1 n=1 Tax=Holothuria leucospilota TaxID=206669 RepID=A0A9Q1CBR4_HOLLE|nr:Beta-catenin-like protein 1 [Holothuria leucospilota]
MDVGELLAFQPGKPNLKRRSEEEEDIAYEEQEVRPRKDRHREVSQNAAEGISSLTEEQQEQINKIVNQEPEGPSLDDAALRKMILNFEKKVFRNQEMRIKFTDQPEKFMESELELNDAIQELHVIATIPEMYHHLVELNAVKSFIQLISHENVDISIAVIDLLQELTDVDSLTDNEQDAGILIDALLEDQVVATLVTNLDRLDDNIKEESNGIHNTLAIIENILELASDMCAEVAAQNLMQWLLKKLKPKVPFTPNKLYASEIIAILLQNTDGCRSLLGELEGIDALLQQLAVFKRQDPNSTEEFEMMENLFNCMCSALLYPPNKEKFLKGEGLQLMNLMLREKKQSRFSALKVMNHAVTGANAADNCMKFIEILGLRNIFPLFMKTPKKQKKGPSEMEHEEHVCAIISALLRNCTGTHRQRLVGKFTEADHAKVDRLIELHFKYMDRVQVVDNRIEKEKQLRLKEGDIIDDNQEDEYFMRRLDAGLFTLQLVDFIILELCCNSGVSSIRERVMKLLNMRGGSISAIRGIVREYAGNIGDANSEEQGELERVKLMELVEKAQELVELFVQSMFHKR